MNYYEILRELYTPEFGSIWKAPNKIWSTGFAHNKSREDLHPTVVARVHTDNSTVNLVPGTSKNYRRDNCVFSVKLNEGGRTTHFLIDLSMPSTVEEVKQLDRGWDGVYELNDEQKAQFSSWSARCLEL